MGANLIIHFLEADSTVPFYSAGNPIVFCSGCLYVGPNIVGIYRGAPK